MARRYGAADASPLIGFAAAGAFGLLNELFGIVTVTVAVRDEVLAGGSLPGAVELREAIRAGWIKVARNPTGLDRFPELDVGEASTLAFALRPGGEYLVLMDEPLGRAGARAHGITVTGLAGVLLAAKRAGLINEIRPLFERLAQTDFRISTSWKGSHAFQVAWPTSSQRNVRWISFVHDPRLDPSGLTRKMSLPRIRTWQRLRASFK